MLLYPTTLALLACAGRTVHLMLRLQPALDNSNKEVKPQWEH
jgi:hypothetical protein